MRRFLLGLSAFFSLSVMAQNTPGSQTITLGSCTSCTFVNGNLTPLTNSGIPFCSGSGSNDAFYTFTMPAAMQAGHQIGIKVTLQGLAFDGVIEILNNANVSIACKNAVAGTADEDLVHYFPNGTTGTFHVRVHSATGAIGAGTFQLCVRQIPELFLRPQFVVTNNAGQPYQLGNTMQRPFLSNPDQTLIQKSGWLAINTATQQQHYTEVNGNSTFVNTNTFSPSLCYGNEYMVFVRIQIGGVWCGYGEGRPIQMADYGIAAPLPAVCGQTFGIYQSQLQSNFLSLNCNYTWQFTTDNGNTVVECPGVPGGSTISLETCSGLRYNKIYTVAISATCCGVQGPFVNTGCFIFTGPLPYTGLIASLCPASIFSGGNLQTVFVANATQYAWRFYPISCGDATFTATGAAVVGYSPSTVYNVTPLGLTPGQCYCCQTKAFVGEQEGDYGWPCQVQILGGGGMVLEPEGDIVLTEELKNTDYMMIRAEDHIFSLYPNPNTGSFDMLIATGKNLDPILIDVFDLSGKVVYSEQRANSGAPDILGLNLDLRDGMFLIRVNSGGYHKTARFMVVN